MAVVLAGCADDGAANGDAETGGSADDEDGGSASPETSATGEGSTGSMTATESGSGSDSGGPSGIDWYPCPIFTGGQGLEAECASIPVPLDWADPGGETIELFVKRLGGGFGGRQMWMLQGGPGGSGMLYESVAVSYMNSDPLLDIYLPDHRGTGRSERLTCPAENPGSPGGTSVLLEKYDACINALDANPGLENLQHFSTTNAARDVGFLIDEVKLETPGQDVFVFGASYGTYWAQRYLQVEPDQADGVVMIGVAAPGFDFRYWERDFNAVGELFVATCDDDPVCSTKLGPDTVARAHAILDSIDTGHCAAAGLDRATLQAHFAARLAWGYQERSEIFAVLYRLERCDAADVAALQFAAPQMQNPLGGLADPIGFAPLLGANIRYGEMYKTPYPTVAELETIHDQTVISFGSGAGSRELADLWPSYTPDALVDGFAVTDMPLLMLEGQYDPNSPLSQAQVMDTQFTGNRQYFVEIPWGNHTNTSPTINGFDCGLAMMFDFLAAPQAQLFSCMTTVVGPDFAGVPGQAASFFGTNDMYENG